MKKPLYFLTLAIFFFYFHSVFASGVYPMSDVLGQTNGTNKLYTTFDINNSPNWDGVSGPSALYVDTTNHRLFVSDVLGQRVLVFNLDSNDHVINHHADYVIGKSAFHEATGAEPTASSSVIQAPQGIAYDPVRDRLFIADSFNRRVLIFNLTGGAISNGMSANYVIGQTGFDKNVSSTTQSNFTDLDGIAYDSVNDRLFVNDTTSNRVLVFNTNPNTLTNGENADFVIGQSNFSLKVATTTQTGLNHPDDESYDSANQRLFISDGANNRQLVFNVATNTISNGEAASFVLGQTNFKGATSTLSQTGLANPIYNTYDSGDNELFVVDANNNRVIVYNVATSTISNGEAASFVLGQVNYMSGSASTTQSTFNSPFGITYDPIGKQLFVGDFNNNRVSVFNVASIVNGQPAVDVLGQSNADTPVYNQGVVNNDPNYNGFNNPDGVVLDTKNHRLFVSDTSNSRILVYDLDSENRLTKTTADFILGQIDFRHHAGASGISSLNSPIGLAYDPDNERLFVADSQNNRVLIYDVTPGTLTNDMNAVHVLGQANFDDNNAGTDTNVFSIPTDVSYDASTTQLFVLDSHNNRVLVFDTSDLMDGMDAIHVIGQQDFQSGDPDLSSTGLHLSFGALVADGVHSRLFVDDGGNNRVLVFDTSDIEDGMAAIHVLGQPDFDTGDPGTSSSTMHACHNGPFNTCPGGAGIAYNPITDQLLVSDSGNNRILLFDTSNITDDQPATAVLGQPDFTSADSYTGLYGLSLPWAISLDTDNNQAYVVDEMNNRVAMYSFLQLQFDTEPTTAASDAKILPAVTVKILDSNGNFDSNADTSVTLAINNNPAGGTLSGSTTKSAVNGVVTFDDLSINNVGSGYTLNAYADDNLVSTTSSAFDITTANSSGGGGGGGAPPTGGGGSGGSSSNNPPPTSNILSTDCLQGEKYARSSGVLCPLSLPVLNPPTSIFLHDLTLGDTGEDVRSLQIYLNTHNFSLATEGIGSLGNETTYFGRLTQAALAKFQKFHNINPPHGYFGPITRSFILSHQ